MCVEGLLALAPGLLEAVAVSQFLRFPSLPRVNHQPLPSQKPVQVLLADLHRAKRAVPLASLARSGRRLHVLHHHIGERYDLLEVCDHPRFGLPPAPGRRRYPARTLEAIIAPLRSPPLAMAP